MVPGLREAVTLMAAGEQRRVWVPEELAYQGEEGRPAGTLVYDVELISIAPPAPLPGADRSAEGSAEGSAGAAEGAPIRTEAPPDVAGPPENATRRPSGLASVVLRRGTGAGHPNAASRVTVHYSGWTTDGELFDSSIPRDEPATFPLSRVIAGWTEGVQLMVIGEQRRFWIPEELAYQGREGSPAGMLVFDIELIAFE
jgi:peptidylprolyl isomerase